MENEDSGSKMEKRVSELSDSVVKPMENEDSESKKGSRITQNLIKPMENHQTRAPATISFCANHFFVRTK